MTLAQEFSALYLAAQLSASRFSAKAAKIMRNWPNALPMQNTPQRVVLTDLNIGLLAMATFLSDLLSPVRTLDRELGYLVDNLVNVRVFVNSATKRLIDTVLHLSMELFLELCNHLVNLFNPVHSLPPWFQLFSFTPIPPIRYLLNQLYHCRRKKQHCNHANTRLPRVQLEQIKLSHISNHCLLLYFVYRNIITKSVEKLTRNSKSSSPLLYQAQHLLVYVEPHLVTIRRLDHEGQKATARPDSEPASVAPASCIPRQVIAVKEGKAIGAVVLIEEPLWIYLLKHGWTSLAWQCSTHKSSGLQPLAMQQLLLR